MKILENKERRLNLVDDLVQREQRVFGGRGAVFLCLDGRAGGYDAAADAPLEHPLLPSLSDVHHQLLHPGFFCRNHVKNRVTRTNERFKFLGEVHCLPLVNSPST